MIVSKIIYENGDKELVRLECQKWEFISDTISTVKVNPGDCLWSTFKFDGRLDYMLIGTWTFIYVYWFFSGHSQLPSQMLVSRQAV